jgi:hypothetical protein
LRETNFGDLPPQGSLLVWIDDLFANPATPFDRTLGRWENIVACTYVIPQYVRGRVNIKAFDLRVKFDPPARARATGWTPQKHAQFRGSVRYWEPDFWKPKTAGAHVEETMRNEALNTCAQRQQQRR